MDGVAPGQYTGDGKPRRQIKSAAVAGSIFVCHVLWFSGFFNLHIAEFLGVKDLATLQALDKLGVFVPGNDSYPGVLADGCHRFGFVGLNFSFRKIVAVFSSFWNGFLLNLFCPRQILLDWPPNLSGQGLKRRQKRSYTEYGPKQSDIPCSS
jgi:hypothetical protein